MTKTFRTIAFLAVVVLASQLLGADLPSIPAKGMVPDEATAVKLADILLPQAFPPEEVNRFVPYHAQLKKDVWTIFGTLKPNSRGGTPMMSISKRDARVLEVWYSQ